MVTSESAAFRILEIVAILFPLLFIAIQLFSGQLREEDQHLTEIHEYTRYIVYAALLLLVVVVGAMVILINQTDSITLIITLTALYGVFLILGFTAAVIGTVIYGAVEEEQKQLDLTTTPPEDTVEEEIDSES